MDDSAYKDFRTGMVRCVNVSEGEGWRKMDKIETSQLINGGTIALALGALSLALGYTEIFLLLAAAGLFAYGVVLVRYFKKKLAKRESDAPER
jgi:O-antigen/teichoic acid export membrane protein